MLDLLVIECAFVGTRKQCGYGVQGVTQLLRHLTPLVQQGNLLEQVEDLVEDRTGTEVRCTPSIVVLSASFAVHDHLDSGVRAQQLAALCLLYMALLGLLSCDIHHVCNGQTSLQSPMMLPDAR